MRGRQPVIGLMAGTSVDGIDVTLALTDGVTLERTGHALTVPYHEDTRRAIWQAVSLGEAFDPAGSAGVCLAERVADDHARAVEMLRQQTDLSVTRIGFHGQTLLHRPDRRLSIQIGDADRLARLTGIEVVHDFRRADLAQGGRGAPLAPVYHQALIDAGEFDLPTVIINIGGVSNLSYWDGQLLLGFDCGPGNALIDDYMREYQGAEQDENGRLAAEGRIDTEAVALVTRCPLLRQSVPRAFDRQDFAWALTLPAIRIAEAADAVATLTQVTVSAIVGAVADLPRAPVLAVVAGGGQYNRTLMKGLRQQLPCALKSADELDLPGAFLEAELMAFLAQRWNRALPSTWPSTTGASRPVVCGRLATP